MPPERTRGTFLPEEARLLRALKVLKIGDRVLDRQGAIGVIEQIEYETGYVRIVYQHRAPAWRPVEKVRKVPEVSV